MTRWRSAQILSESSLRNSPHTESFPDRLVYLHSLPAPPCIRVCGCMEYKLVFQRVSIYLLIGLSISMSSGRKDEREGGKFLLMMRKRPLECSKKRRRKPSRPLSFSLHFHEACIASPMFLCCMHTRCIGRCWMERPAKFRLS